MLIQLRAGKLGHNLSYLLSSGVHHSVTHKYAYKRNKGAAGNATAITYPSGNEVRPSYLHCKRRCDIDKEDNTFWYIL
jgi:hypothetical protein